MIRAGRILCFIGGAMLFLHAFLPTYHINVNGASEPDALYVTFTPMELAFAYRVVGWIAVLPSLMGLHALLLSVGRAPGAVALWVHWVSVVLFFLAYALTVVVMSCAVLVGIPGHRLATLGLWAPALLICVIAGRAILRKDLMTRAPTLVHVLLCQSLLMIMAAPALLTAFMRGPTAGGIVLGVGAMLLLVGARKWVKGLLAPIPQPPGSVLPS